MTTRFSRLPMPPHFNPSNAHDGHYHVTDAWKLELAADSWRRQHNLMPVGSSTKRLHMLLIDPQFDFSHSEGSLFVGGRSGTGAMDDQAKLARFIYQYLHVITGITPTMDTHLLHQVFYPSAHLRDDDSHPEPFTTITAADYRSGKYRPNPAMASENGMDPVFLQRQFVHYCEQLEKSGKYSLTLWPYHCVIGSHGHQLAGIVDEARQFHGFARGVSNTPEIKGGNPLTEHYSIFQPEVTTLWNGQPIPGVTKNTRLIERLLRSDVVVITGEAASHCLAWTIDDLLTHILANDPSLAKKVYIMTDCTSPVVIPGVVDYTADAEAAFARFQNAGMHLVKSTDPIEDWPGISL